ncbi:MAG: hypothetical protein ABSC48_16750 [Terracidiphilus sp.]|jgi:hypothetical protein
MPRLLAIISILFILATVGVLCAQSTPENGIAKQSIASQGKQQTNAKYEDQYSAKVPSVVVQVESPTNDSHSAEDQENIQLQRKITRFSKWLMIATVVLAIVGVLQFVLLIRQEDILREARDIIRAQDEHMIASERAWVLLHTKKTQLPTLIPIDGPPPVPGEHPFAQCMVSLKNFGITPAHISVCEFEIQLGNSNTVPPSVSIYETVVGSRKYSIGPNESWPIQALLKSQLFVNSANLTGIKQWREFLWMCGVIRYSDVFREKIASHETRVCLLYDPKPDTDKPFWVIAGPPEYNSAT